MNYVFEASLQNYSELIFSLFLCPPTSGYPESRRILHGVMWCNVILARGRPNNAGEAQNHCFLTKSKMSYEFFYYFTKITFYPKSSININRTFKNTKCLQLYFGIFNDF